MDTAVQFIKTPFNHYNEINSFVAINLPIESIDIVIHDNKWSHIFKTDFLPVMMVMKVVMVILTTMV